MIRLEVAPNMFWHLKPMGDWTSKTNANTLFAYCFSKTGYTGEGNHAFIHVGKKTANEIKAEALLIYDQLK